MEAGVIKLGNRVAHNGVEFTVYGMDDDYVYSVRRRQKIKKSGAVVTNALDCRRALDPAIKF